MNAADEHGNGDTHTVPFAMILFRVLSQVGFLPAGLVAYQGPQPDARKKGSITYSDVLSTAVSLETRNLMPQQ